MSAHLAADIDRSIHKALAASSLGMSAREDIALGALPALSNMRLGINSVALPTIGAMPALDHLTNIGNFNSTIASIGEQLAKTSTLAMLGNWDVGLPGISDQLASIAQQISNVTLGISGISKQSMDGLSALMKEMEDMYENLGEEFEEVTGEEPITLLRDWWMGWCYTERVGDSYHSRSDFHRIDRLARHAIYRLQGGMCLGCDKKTHESQMTKDHIKPKSKGGSNHITNIRLICGSCNSVKGDRDDEYLVIRVAEREDERRHNNLEYRLRVKESRRRRNSAR